MLVLNVFSYFTVSDFDAITHIYDHAFTQCLHIDPSEHPILLADPIGNTRDRREQICQLMFENYKAPAGRWVPKCDAFRVCLSVLCFIYHWMTVFMPSHAVLSAFSMGKTTALVMDIGAAITTCVPVFEGFTIKRGVAKNKGNLFNIAFAQPRIKQFYVNDKLRLEYKLK